jgi:hypothetical protein
MWNSGSEVIIRSAAVSSIQNGNPSPAMADAWWVWMTSLDRPVVPDVGISTAGSAGATAPSSRRACRAAAAIRPGSGQKSGTSAATSRSRRSAAGGPPAAAAAALASVARAASFLSVISARGRVCPIRPASSAAELRGLTATVTAPSDASASQQVR